MKLLNPSYKYAKELNDYLLNLEIIKEYQKYERLIEKNQELKELEKKMKSLQKTIVRQKANQDDCVVDTIAVYQKIKAEFENHPLVVNYLYLKEEVNDLLQSINGYINQELLK